jgi:hypothetical protein
VGFPLDSDAANGGRAIGAGIEGCGCATEEPGRLGSGHAGPEGGRGAFFGAAVS